MSKIGNLLASGICTTGNLDKYEIYSYEGKAVIKVNSVILRLDPFDIASLVESLFKSLNVEQRNNLVKSLKKNYDLS